MDSQMLAEKPGFLEKSDFQKAYDDRDEYSTT
jgi:hypothetical protein